MKKNNLVVGALILTCANLITRVLGFVYRIYMSNLIGAEGMGLYQLIMPVYFLAWSIAASGFSTTVSKLVAQENAKKEYGNMGRILKQSVLICTCIGLAISLLLFQFAGFISTNLIHDSRTFLSLKFISLCFPFMAASSCIRGYFFGLQKSAIPAISQVLEQLVRMGVVFLLAASFMPRGLEYACAAASIGIICEELFSFCFIVISYILFKKKNKLIKRPIMSSAATLSSIISMALPLTLNRVSGSLLATVEDVLIPQKLMQSGAGSVDAMSMFGRLMGMAMPLIQFPSAFLVALAITLVPEISSALAVGNHQRVNATITKSILFTAIVGVGAGAVFLMFPNEMGIAIYNQDSIGPMLIKLAWLCPFMYLQMVLSGILNGLGRQLFIFRNSLLSSAINLFFIWFFIPRFGINGFLIGWFVSLLVTTSLCLHKINQVAAIKPDFMNWVCKPLLCVTAAALVFRFIGYKYIFSMFTGLTGLFSSVGAMLITYLALLLLTGTLSRSDLTVFRNKKVQS